jgi:hypothetical protein
MDQDHRGRAHGAGMAALHLGSVELEQVTEEPAPPPARIATMLVVAVPVVRRSFREFSS